MSRASLIIKITELQVQIDNLEVMANKYTNGANLDATREQLHEARQEIRTEIDRLRTIDEAWIKKNEHSMELLQKKAEASDPGEKARLMDQVQEYRQRIEKRKQSMEEYG